MASLQLRPTILDEIKTRFDAEFSALRTRLKDRVDMRSLRNLARDIVYEATHERFLNTAALLTHLDRLPDVLSQAAGRRIAASAGADFESALNEIAIEALTTSVAPHVAAAFESQFDGADAAAHMNETVRDILDHARSLRWRKLSDRDTAWLTVVDGIVTEIENRYGRDFPDVTEDEELLGDVVQIDFLLGLVEGAKSVRRISPAISFYHHSTYSDDAYIYVS